MDIRRDDETYTFIRIQIDAQGRVNQMPSTEHKRIAAEPAPKTLSRPPYYYKLKASL